MEKLKDLVLRKEKEGKVVIMTPKGYYDITASFYLDLLFLTLSYGDHDMEWGAMW